MQSLSVSAVLISHLTKLVFPEQIVCVEGSYFNKPTLGLVAATFNKAKRAFLHASDYRLSTLHGIMPATQEYTVVTLGAGFNLNTSR